MGTKNTKDFGREGHHEHEGDQPRTTGHHTFDIMASHR
jgi:hypothetical protein